MTLRFTQAKGLFINVILAYAPTIDANYETHIAFYEQIEEVLAKVPRYECIVLLGDFNDRVGKEREIWRGLWGDMGSTTQMLVENYCLRGTRPHHNIDTSWIMSGGIQDKTVYETKF